ncbi:alpha-tocopherol transfer protein-like [Daktulosphaira vitifoliae]|uniref:alpha-tocopherol transfer protein-like n=1 Tax=Daktulosphaira vitifoliae TaxID=58002 RepID=UPI0021AAC13B|nr:alpha-tocopherol transfer protein-like [Daktulosphaira vitifoliae]
MDIVDNKILILPTPFQIIQIYKDLNTNEKRIKVDVKLISEWMKKQPHLPNAILDEKRITQFLIYSKNSLEKTKKSLEKYYTIKTLKPKFFCNWDSISLELTEAMNYGMLVPLPVLTSEGNRVSLGYFRHNDYKKFNFVNFGKLIVMTFDIRISKLDLYKKEILIWDMKHFSTALLPEIITHINEFVQITSVAYPLRIERVHIINVPKYANSIINLICSLLKKKITERFIIHKTNDDLKNYINPKILPIDYGGLFSTTSEEIMDNWKEELIKNRNWFLSHNKVLNDEQKRTKSSKIKYLYDDTEGSFRKLDID